MTVQTSAVTGKFPFTALLGPANERSRQAVGSWLARLGLIGRRRGAAPTYRSDWYRDDFKIEFDRRLLGQ